MVDAFLHRAGWGAARRLPMAGDASTRRYERLTLGARRAVLMIAPRDARKSFDAFLGIARHLRRHGLSAPMILHADPCNGLMILEDLGQTRLADLLGRPHLARPLYTAAVDLLTALADLPPPPGLPRLDPPALAAMTAPAFTHYAPSVAPAPVVAALSEALARTALPEALALRDCHAENLMWLPRRHGHRRLGLLDFQDAVMAPLGYDLVSLLDDARRDLAPRLRAEMLERFACARGIALGRLDAAAAPLTLARNLRILGVFARLAQAGKPAYLRHQPRVYAHVRRALSHPACAALQAPLAHLPAPEVPCRAP